MKRINVNKTFLPPLDEYKKYLKEIWKSEHITNQGPLLVQFETLMKERLGLDNFHYVTNGTLALQIAIRALGVANSEVITTPFSYVATTSSLLWEGCKPVFVDIDESSFCIDASKIEDAITPNTKAILAVHVFGNACDIDAIEIIARKHNLKVIYDGAHAFGVKYKGKSLLDYGDASICSFHATKVFHTIEGGCIVTRDKSVSEKVELLKRFGHNGDNHIMLGINAKASEFQAAMGLCNLPYVDRIIADRKNIAETYDKHLEIEGKPASSKNTDHNYAYYPVVFETEKVLDKVVKLLAAENIFPRRYFYPSLNQLPYISDASSCPVSENISSRILCLPLYAGLELEVVEKISNIINRADA